MISPSQFNPVILNVALYSFRSVSCSLFVFLSVLLLLLLFVYFVCFFSLFVSVPRVKSGVHSMLGEKVACAAVSLQL